MATSPTTNNMDAGFTSFSNPNYRLEDLINCNIHTTQENIYNSLDSPSSPTNTSLGNKMDARKFHMDLLSPNSESSDFSTFQSPMSPGSDGEGDLHDLRISDHISDDTDGDTYESIDEVRSHKTHKGPASKSGGFLGYYAMLENKAKEMKSSITRGVYGEEIDCGSISLSNSHSKDSDISSPDSNDSGIQSDSRSEESGHIHGPINDDIYSIIKKTNKKDAQSPQEMTSLLDDRPDGSTDLSTPTNDEQLPIGWQKYYDQQGSYFWHIKSGTIQRDFPTASDPYPDVPVTPPTFDKTEDAIATLTKDAENLITKTDLPTEDSSNILQRRDSTVRYAVRSLGWVSIAEDDLTPERSSKAVNKCIVDLSLGRNDINDVVGRWGDGNDLYLDLDSDSLRLVHPTDEIVLNSQPIHSVRVWGVGRDNGRERDFAYVARDKVTRKHMCHVFRCDVPAREIANTLRDICKKIMMQRRQVQAQQPTVTKPPARPNNLPNLSSTDPVSLLSQFPTPMDEPRKVLHCHYIGCERVHKSTGMDVVNSAIERAYTKVPTERWVFVDVAIAPSTISIYEHGNMNNKIDECRVRFLAFMGIARKNTKLCAFILHLAGDQFFAHVFHCEPSAGPLCKTIEAACKLRYQKCLDSHHQATSGSNGHEQNQHSTVKTIGESVKSGVQRGVSNIVAFVRSATKDMSSPTKV